MDRIDTETLGRLLNEDNLIVELDGGVTVSLEAEDTPFEQTRWGVRDRYILRVDDPDTTRYYAVLVETGGGDSDYSDLHDHETLRLTEVYPLEVTTVQWSTVPF